MENDSAAHTTIAVESDQRERKCSLGDEAAGGSIFAQRALAICLGAYPGKCAFLSQRGMVVSFPTARCARE